MSLQLSIFDLLIIIGMVTGIVCSVLLFGKAQAKPANRFLALGLLSFVWLNTKTLFHSFEIWEVHGVGFFPNSVELAIPPLFYFYLRSLLQPALTFKKRDWLHFLPFIISQAYSIVVYVATMQTAVYAEKHIIGEQFAFYTIKTLDEYLMIVVSLGYLWAVFRPVWTTQPQPGQTDLVAAERRFLKQSLVALGFLVVYALANLILNLLIGHAYPWRWQLNHVLVAAVVYYLGMVGYKNADQPPGSFTSKLREKKPESVDEDLLSRLQTAMAKEQFHLNPKLTLKDLAQYLGVGEAALSSTINAHYQKNFRGYINQVRVEAVKERLRTEGLGNLSLLGIAKECGFNSEASFYRVFKEVVGMTPKQFLSDHQA